MSESIGCTGRAGDISTHEHPSWAGAVTRSSYLEGQPVAASGMSRSATSRASAPRGDSPRRESTSTRAAPKVTERPLILVVDDFEDNRDLYSAYLTLSGYRVIEAEDGLDGVEKATAESPDLIVMDLAMPRMDGWQAIEILRADGRTRDIPVVVLTGSGAAAQARASALGCASFLMKPCMPQDLVSVVRAHVATPSVLTPAGRGGEGHGQGSGPC